MRVFAPEGFITLSDLAETIGRSEPKARDITKELMAQGHLEELTLRPLRFRLTTPALERLGQSEN